MSIYDNREAVLSNAREKDRQGQIARDARIAATAAKTAPVYQNVNAGVQRSGGDRDRFDAEVRRQFARRTTTSRPSNVRIRSLSPQTQERYNALTSENKELERSLNTMRQAMGSGVMRFSEANQLQQRIRETEDSYARNQEAIARLYQPQSFGSLVQKRLDELMSANLELEKKMSQQHALVSAGGVNFAQAERELQQLGAEHARNLEGIQSRVTGGIDRWRELSSLNRALTDGEMDERPGLVKELSVSLSRR